MISQVKIDLLVEISKQYKNERFWLIFGGGAKGLSDFFNRANLSKK